MDNREKATVNSGQRFLYLSELLLKPDIVPRFTRFTAAPRLPLLVALLALTPILTLLTTVEAQQPPPVAAPKAQVNEAKSSAVREEPSMIRFQINPANQSEVRIDGTSRIHDWHILGRMIEGHIDLAADALTHARKAPAGEFPVEAELRIPVRSLKSVDANGVFHSTAMDNVMYQLLRETDSPEIVCSLTGSVAKAGLTGSMPAMLEAKGTLAVAGSEQEITLPVEMTLAERELKFLTKVKLKMSTFHIDTPEAMTVNGPLKLSDDEVMVSVNGSAFAVTIR